VLRLEFSLDFTRRAKPLRSTQSKRCAMSRNA
jgi:hypothetical protein